MADSAELDTVDDDEIVLSVDTVEYVEDPPQRPTADVVYFRRPTALLLAWVCFGVGLMSIAFAAAGFAIALALRVDQITLQFLVTGPTLVGIALIAASRLMAQTPKQVTVGPEGLCIDHERQPRQKIAWQDIAWAAVGNAGLMQQRQLLIYDRQGKTLVGLSDSFEDYKQLIKQIQKAVAKKQDETSESVRRSKARKSALFLGAAAAFLSFIAGANFWMASETERTDALFERDAIAGQAEVVRVFVAPNGVTKRLEYRVTGHNGQTATRNAEVTDAYYHQLETATTVPVRYVPAEPAISRLVDGEVTSKDVTDSPGLMKAVSLVLGGLCVLLFIAAAMQWNGWDLDFDTQSGRLSIQRFGGGR